MSILEILMILGLGPLLYFTIRSGALGCLMPGSAQKRAIDHEIARQKLSAKHNAMRLQKD